MVYSVKLMKHQSDARERYSSSDELGLFLEMRLGKTLITHYWIGDRGYRDVLIVAPLSAHDGWTELGYDPITYQRLARNPEIADRVPDAVVLDESTMIKSPRSAVAKIAIRKLSRARGRAILTGIPTPEKLLDCFTQMAFLRGGSFMGHKNFWSWRNAFFLDRGYTFVPKKGVADKISAEMHASGTFLTRAEAGVGAKKTYVRIERRLPMEARLECKMLASRFQLTNGIQTKQAPVVVAWMHRACGGHVKPGIELPCWKYDEVLSLTAKHGKLVVWCCYGLELRRLWRLLKSNSVPAVFIQGATPRRVRAERRSRFFAAKRMVLIAQPTCARFGADYSCAEACVYLSSPWSHETRAQSEDRIVHPFKNEERVVYDLVNKDSVDTDILEAISVKKDVSRFVAARTGLR